MYEVFGAGAPLLTVLIFFNYQQQAESGTDRFTLTVKTVIVMMLVYTILLNT